MAARIGHAAPDFTLPAHDGRPWALRDARGGAVVLYFYPRDNTPACTKQGCDLRDAFPAFREDGATIVGISPDSVASHAKFRQRFGLPFTLLSDPDHTVAERYGVWREKRLFGLRYMGIVRTTFVIDGAGVLRSIIPVTRVARHVEAVREALREV